MAFILWVWVRLCLLLVFGRCFLRRIVCWSLWFSLERGVPTLHLFFVNGLGLVFACEQGCGVLLFAVGPCVVSFLRYWSGSCFLWVLFVGFPPLV